MYKIQLTRQAVKDADSIERAGMKPRTAKLVRIVRENPFQNPPEYEKLKGYPSTYSRRINKQHRFVYEVLPNTEDGKDEEGNLYDGVVKVIRMWTHYE